MSKNKEKKEKEYSKHHLLCQHPYWTSYEGSSHSHNIISIPDVKHRAIHSLFENFMIAQQLITMVNISEKALKPEVKQWLLDTLNSKDIFDPTERYKDECIK